MQDYHLHTKHSTDGREEVEAICAAAVQAGMQYIAITDHEERGPERFHVENIPLLMEEIERAKAKFPQLSIARGLEIDYNPDFWEELSALPIKYDLDYTLISLHWVNSRDPYQRNFFDQGDQHACYTIYLQALLDMVNALETPCILGHLTYVSKFAPFDKKELHYADYSDLFDAILKTTAQKGYGIEINTSGLKNQSVTLPCADVVKRYRELGGEFLTLGSDAHAVEYVGYEIDTALDIARAAGFRTLTTFRARQPQMIAI